MINKEEVFAAFDNHLCTDERPSLFFEEFYENEKVAGELPYKLLADLKNVEQSPRHHPEGNVWKHTMLVVDRAAERKQFSKEPRVLMWAALLHDLGKAEATAVRGGRITAYDHDKMGEKTAVKFLRPLTEDEDFIGKVAKMVRWHMQILFVVKKLPYGDLERMIKEADINEIGLLSICDRLGRGELSQEQVREEHKNLEVFLNKCRQVMVKV